MRPRQVWMAAGTLAVAGMLGVSVGEAAAPAWPSSWTQTGITGDHRAVWGDGPGVRWTLHVQGALKGQVSVVDGVAYFGSNGHMVYAVDARTGRVLWRTPVGNKAMNAPVVAGDLVYEGVGNHDMQAQYPNVWIRGTGPNGIYALNRATGKVAWFFPTRAEVMAGMAYERGTLYAADGEHWLYAIDARTGRLRWRVQDNGVDSMSSLALANHVLYFCAGGPRDPALQAYSTTTGRLLWETRGHANGDNSPAVGNGIVVIENVLPYTVHGRGIIRDDIRAYSLSGRLLWHYLTGPGPRPKPPTLFAAPPALIAGGVVYAGSLSSQRAYALQAQTGRLLWKTRLPGPTVASPVLWQGHVVFTTKTGDIVTLDARTGRVQGRLSLGGHFGPSYPVIVNGTLYVGNTDGTLYALPVSSLVPAH